MYGVRVGLRRKRAKFGQVFLTDQNVARKEASFGKHMNVLEFGTGGGILTRELCKVAEHVTSIELDKDLFMKASSRLDFQNLNLINADFFSPGHEEYKAEMLISNIPYCFSRETVLWLSEHRIPAVLCVQEEFAQKMVANPATRDYTHISVISQLLFKIKFVMRVPKNRFRPTPKVDSVVVYMEPKGNGLDKSVVRAISAIMEHKKNKLKKAVVYAAKELRIPKEDVGRLDVRLADRRVSELKPEEILCAVIEVLNNPNKIQ